MSDEQPEPTAEQQESPHTGMVQQAHGGAINRGNRRPTDPTPEDVSALARKRLYQGIPELNRIVRNRPIKPKRGGQTKRPYRAIEQIAAMRELRELAKDRMLSRAQVQIAAMNTAAVIAERLPRDQAQMIIQAIAPFWEEM